MTTFAMFSTIIVALITAVIGPLLLTWFKNKIENIIDAGANTGSQAVRFFHYYQNLRKIICIEPDFANYKYLNKNLDNQKCINIHAALSSSINDKISLNYNNFEKKKNGKPTNKSELITTSIKNDDDIKDLIKVVTINSVIKSFHLNKIDFFKCDLNGFEKEIFKANTEWINICKSFYESEINFSEINIFI